MNYAVTLKQCGKTNGNANEILMSYGKLLQKVNGISCGYDWEYDNWNRLHLHAHIMARKSIYIKGIQQPYMHIDIKPLETIDDVQRWVRYIHKQNKEVCDYFHCNYGFV